MTTSTATDIPRPRFARMYLKAAARADRRGAAEHRRRLLAGLHGRVVEIGAGHGINFAPLPHHGHRGDRDQARAEPPRRRRKAADAAPITVTVRAGTADALPLGNGEIDAAVASLVLCSVPNPARTLAELRRVLRPGGELRFYEHVIARRQPKRLLLQLADSSGLWPAIAGGCHPARDTGAAIDAAGFSIERSERFGFSPSASSRACHTFSAWPAGPDHHVSAQPASRPRANPESPR